MFDTIRYKLENMSKYGHKIEQFLKSDRVTIGNLQFVEFNNSPRHQKEKNYVKSKLTSGSYDINFNIDLSSDEMLFEYSIPKYMYGNNVRMYGDFENPNPITLIHDHIKLFFKNEFYFVPDFNDIRILRIDICFNYVFRNYQNKLAFKSVQEKMLSDVLRVDKVINYSDNTVYYKTRRFSFKIYDKFEEFKKHDFAHIEKIQGREKAVAIHLESQNMLRFEMTLRGSKLTDIFINGLGFNQVSGSVKQSWKSLKSIAKKTESDLTNLLNLIKAQRNKSIENFVSKRLSYTNEMIINFSNQLNEYTRLTLTVDDINFMLTNESLAAVKEWNKIRNQKGFMLRLPPFQKAVNLGVKHSNMYEFDSALCNSCITEFVTIVKQFTGMQGKKLDSVRLIRMYEPDLKGLVSCKPLISYLELSKKYSDKQIVTRGHMAARTLRVRKQELKKVNTFLEQIESDYRVNKYNLQEVPDIKYNAIFANSSP